MWARNLLFFAVSLTGLVALGASLFRQVESNQEHPRRTISDEQREGIRLVASSIDAAMAAKWQEEGLTPAGPADELTVIRRLALALVGTTPSLEEIRWLERLPADQQFEAYLDALFADRRYSDYMAERLVRPLVGVEQGPFLVYRRRRFVSWMADQLYENRRYDAVIRDCLASDGIWTAQPATNFVTVSLQQDKNNLPDVDKLAGRVCRAVLGVRLDCAQCHDHPFASWEQNDFQGLAAFYGRTKLELTGLKDNGEPHEFDIHATGETKAVEPSVPYAAELLPKTGPVRERLAIWVTHEQNKAFARATANRMWAFMFGRALVEPVDDISIDGPHPETLNLLADDFAASGHDLQRLVRIIAATQAFQADSRAAEDSELTPRHAAEWAAFPISRLRPEQAVGGVLQSASLTTIDYDSHIITRITRATSEQDFVKRYGDAGVDELEDATGTVTQRLLMLNGNLVAEKTKNDMINNAATRIARLAPTDEKAIETAYLATLTRRPNPEELSHFTSQLKGTTGEYRIDVLCDLYWALINSTEFSWNH
ncbi:MAG: DUF1549 domain-containing protein [Planctomycetales bacterium]|nr:DUF1549 domain-containing protein [Planctomycetales bacterium]